MAVPSVPAHAPWCAAAGTEHADLPCTSTPVQVAGVQVWIAQSTTGPRLTASGDALLSRTQMVDLIQALVGQLTR